MGEELAVMEKFEALAVHRAPEVVLDEARKAAKALTTVIEGKKKKVVFNGETYLENEDWLTVARFYGVTSRIRVTNYIEYGDVRGFEATAEAYLVGSGEVISTSESMCLNDEPNWAKKPLFQLRSMAQTRASSRVLRQVFGWVVVLAGYKATPAEEMDGVVMGSPKYGKPKQPVGDVMCDSCRALNGHLPSCKYHPSRKTDSSHATKAQEATPAPQPSETTTAAPEAPKTANERAVVRVVKITQKTKDLKDKAGNVTGKQPYLVLDVQQDNVGEWTLFVWHKTLFETAVRLGSKIALIEYSQKTQGNRTFCQLEAVLEVMQEPDSGAMVEDDDFDK